MKNQQLITQNLYEIPSCSICLNELTQQLSSLACGHVFHISCITQHFQYKGTCPNCQKRAQLKEIRLVVYPVVHNTKAGSYLRALLANIDKSQGQQVEGLLQQVKILSERSQRLDNSYRESQKQLKKKCEQVQKIKREIQSKYIEVANLRKQNVNLNTELKQQKIQHQRLKVCKGELQDSYQVLLTLKKQMQHYKSLQKSALQNSEQLLRYKIQLESQNTPPELIAKSFFQMLQLKNLSILRMKQKHKQYAERYKIKQQENMRLRKQIQEAKKNKEEVQAELEKLRAKYDKIREKYKEIVQKQKDNNNKMGKNNHKSQQNLNNNGNNNIINDNSNHGSDPNNNCAIDGIEQNSLSLSIGFSNKLAMKQTLSAGAAVNSNQKTEKVQTMFNIMEKPKATQSKFSFGNQALKKQVQDKKGQLTLKNFMK